MGLLSVLSIDHNRKGRKQLKFTKRDRHREAMAVWIKKDESEFLGRGHNGMRKGLGPRKRGEEEGNVCRRGNEMTGCKNNERMKGHRNGRWEMVVNCFFL